jgi:hypothetical protein
MADDKRTSDDLCVAVAAALREKAGTLPAELLCSLWPALLAPGRAGSRQLP